MVRLTAVFKWLTKSTDSLPKSERRRAHLLTWLLLFSIFLTITAFILVLIVNPPHSPRRLEYGQLIVTLFALFLVAYGLNRKGRYYPAAGLTIVCAIFGPWGSLLLDPTILQGDFVPLTYIVISVLLSSILLPPLLTVVLAALQLIALALVPFFSPAAASINWPSLVAFVFFTAVLSIIANFISQRDLAVIDHQTRQLALSEARLRELSIRDHLTNLFNRRYLEETLEREVQRAARKHYPLGVIMLDIDHFKQLNDTLGHAAGDALFQALGKLLGGQVRNADIACRYGGDEFALILPEASEAVTTERAELLRDKVKHLHVEYENCALKPFTISLGVAVFPEHGSSGELLLKSADGALYQAKHAGRDCVMVSE